MKRRRVVPEQAEQKATESVVAHEATGRVALVILDGWPVFPGEDPRKVVDALYPYYQRRFGEGVTLKVKLRYAFAN